MREISTGSLVNYMYSTVLSVSLYAYTYVQYFS